VAQLQKRYKARDGAKKFFSHKMASAESDIEIEGGAADGQLVRWVLHDKDNEAEVELLAEDRWVSHGAIALLRNSMKATVPLEGTCKPKEEEAIRKDMVTEFAQLPHSQKVMFGRKAIKNYRSRVRHRKKTQEMLVGTSSRAGGAKWRGEQSNGGESRKTPRMRARLTQCSWRGCGEVPKCILRGKNLSNEQGIWWWCHVRLSC
jgi:hypothetical protein